MLRACRLTAILMILAMLGCGKKTSPGEYALDAEPAEFGELRLTRTINESELTEAMLRLEAEQVLPLQLDEAWRTGGSAADQAAMERILEHPGPDQARRDLETSDRWFRGPRLGIDTGNYEVAVALAQRWRAGAKQARPLWSKSRSPFPNQTAAGFLEDVRWVETTKMLGRGELLAGWLALREGEVDNAGERIGAALDLSRCLGQVPSVYVRRVAGELRRETFLVLDQWLRSPGLTRVQLEKLSTTVERLVDQWPADRTAWEADRARGLQFYEMIRAGRFHSLLTDQEFLELIEASKLASRTRAIERGLNSDQLFYLRRMADVIQAAQNPYHQRRSALDEIAVQIDLLAATADDPLVARTFLLVDLHPQQVLAATDLATALAWRQALLGALGDNTNDPVTNPLTGLPQEMIVEQTRVVIPPGSVGPNSPEIVVPRL
ncbi:MAG: hypothetical protein WD045_12445 [Pirellulaceae bacterium]